MNKIKQKDLETSAALQSILIKKGSKLNDRYAPLIEDFESLHYPQSRLDTKKIGDTSWKLPDFKLSEKGYTLDTHAATFGKTSIAWNYLTLARDIAIINDLASWPTKEQIMYVFKKRKIKTDIFTRKDIQLAPEKQQESLVKDYPIEEVLEILFGNKNIQWKDAAALIKGWDNTVHKPEPLTEFIPTSGMLFMKGDQKRFDKYAITNAMIQAENRPVPSEEVSKKFRIKDFETKPLEWNLAKSANDIYREMYDKLVKDTIPNSKTNARGLQLFDQWTDIYDNPHGGLFKVNLSHVPEYDTNMKLANQIFRAIPAEEMLHKGEKSPVAYFLYTIKNYDIALDWKTILGKKD